MPTSRAAIAAVAATLGGVAVDDAPAVEMFYRGAFTAYPAPVRALIADYLMAQSGPPSPASLLALREMVGRPESELPDIDAPAWDEAFGPAMAYAPDPAEHDPAPLAMGA